MKQALFTITACSCAIVYVMALLIGIAGTFFSLQAQFGGLGESEGENA